MRFARSLSFGHHFDPPVAVADAGERAFAGFAALGRAPDGEALAAWLDGRDPEDEPGTFSLRAARTVARGERFEPSVRVAGAACPCCRPAVALFPGGGIALAWRRTFPDRARDVVVSVSGDGGRSWAEPVRVATDDWRTEGCQHSGPAAVWTGDALWVAWTTEGRARAPGVWIARSRDGRTFDPPVHASAGVLDANHPQWAVAPDGALALAFEGRADGADSTWATVGVFACTVSGSGASPAHPLPMRAGSSAAYPVVAAGGAGRLVVAWTNAAGGASAATLARGRAR